MTQQTLSTRDRLIARIEEGKQRGEDVAAFERALAGLPQPSQPKEMVVTKVAAPKPTRATAYVPVDEETGEPITWDWMTPHLRSQVRHQQDAERRGLSRCQRCGEFVDECDGAEVVTSHQQVLFVHSGCMESSDSLA